MPDINTRAAKDCEFHGHSYVGQSNCVYCNTPQVVEEHPIFQRLFMLKSNLSMRFMRAVRAGNTDLRDTLLAKIDAIEAVEQIAHEEYDDA